MKYMNHQANRSPGSIIRNGQFTPARIKATQNIHLQSLTEVYPATIGPMSGPTVEIRASSITALPLGRRSG